MNQSGIIVAALVIIVAGTVGAVYIFNDPFNLGIDGFEYDLTYELDGGRVPDDAPKTYIHGKDLYLPNAYKSGHVFAGWYLDRACSESFDGDTEYLPGDTTLYASWEESLAGQYAVYSERGHCNLGEDSYTVTGTFTYTYLSYSDTIGSYRVRNDFVETYEYGSGETETTEKSITYWSTELACDTYSAGKETIDTVNGPKECELEILVFDDGGFESHWTGDDGVLYKIVYYETIDATLGYDLRVEYLYESEGWAEPDRDHSLTVYQGCGITVTGAEEASYAEGRQVTLRASIDAGYSFDGWYDLGGKLLSKDPAYSLIVSGPVELYAFNTKDYDLILESDREYDLDSVTGLSGVTYEVVETFFMETVSDVQGTYIFEDGGLYYLKASTDGGYRMFFVRVTGDVDRTYVWKYNDLTYSVDLTIDYEDYLYAAELYDLDERSTDPRNGYAHDKTFVTLSYTDERMAPYMDELTDKLIAEYQSTNFVTEERGLLNYLLAFVQYLDYRTDLEDSGAREYWKFPLETLCESGGDCEDTSMLFCALAHQCREKLGMDYRTGFIIIPEHMAGAVKLSRDSEWSYCETTGKSFEVGEVPDDTKKYLENPDDYTIVEVL